MMSKLSAEKSLLPKVYFLFQQSREEKKNLLSRNMDMALPQRQVLMGNSLSYTHGLCPIQAMFFKARWSYSIVLIVIVSHH